MIKSVVKFLNLQDRIDAEYYKPEYLEMESLLLDAGLLKDAVVISKEREDPTKYRDKKFCYLEIDNVNLQTGSIQPQELFSFEAPSRARKKVKSGDSIISTVRPNRNAVAFISKELENCICSTGFTVLHPRKILPEYLFAFLKSRFAVNQLVRLTTAAMYPAVSEDDISNIKIPIPPRSFQQKIEKIVKETHRKRKLADEKYKEAEELLEKELGIKDLELETKGAYRTNFSEVMDRLDPEYYQPKYKRVQTLIAKNKFEKQPLKSFVKKYNCGLAFPTEIYLEKGVPLLRIKNLKKMQIDFEDVKFLPNLDEYQEFIARSGDILISMSGTVGLTSLVPENIPKAFVNQRITSISTEGIDRLYLCLYLNLLAINSLMVKETTGGVQKNITYRDIVSIPVPILPKPTQQKIADLVRQSHEARKKAKQLLEEAKQKVEDLVEKGNW